MAQAFVTTYKNHYRWNSIEKRHLMKPYDPCAEKQPEGDMWLTMDDFGLPKEGGEKISTDADRMVKELYKERMRTTYQLHYCGLGAVRSPLSERDDNELLEYCRNLYDRRKGKKVLPPLPSAKRINGHMRPSRIYIPLTVYQQVHGQLGYNVMKPTNASGVKNNQETEVVAGGDETKAEEQEVPAPIESKKSSPSSPKSPKKRIMKVKLDCGCRKCQCKKHYQRVENK